MKKLIIQLKRISTSLRGIKAVLISIFLFQLKVYAQKPIPVIDSLRKELDKEITDSTKSLIMAELSYKYYTIPDSHFTIAQRGLKLATSIGFARGIAANKYSLGAYYDVMGDYETGIKYINEALSIGKRYNNKIELGRMYQTLGTLLGFRGDYNESIENYKKSYKYFKEANDLEGQLWSFNNIGYSFFLLHQYDSSQYYLREGESLARTTNYDFIASAIYGSMAELYSTIGNHEKSAEYLLEAIKINDDVDLTIQSDNYIQLAKLYLEKGDQTKALVAAHKGLNLAEKSNNLHRITAANKMLSDVYEKALRFNEALKYLKNAFTIHDSLFSINQKKSIREVRLASQAQMKLLEQENELKRVRLDMQDEEIIIKNLLLISALALFSLTTIIALLLNRQSRARNKNIKIVERKNEEIVKQAKQLTALNKELISLNENLENKARARAAIILEQEKKIADYTFINSHKLRAPVATIMGIVNLIKAKHVNEKELNELIKSIDSETQKIDSVVREITKAIE